MLVLLSAASGLEQGHVPTSWSPYCSPLLVGVGRVFRVEMLRAVNEWGQ